MFKRKIIQNELFEGIMGETEFLVYQGGLTYKERENLVLISITDPDNTRFVSDNKINTIGFHDVIETKFWDIEEGFGNYNPISDEQGLELKNFIIKNKDKKFLIHCKAGQSRSAGVGKAVECLVHYHGDVYIYRTSHSYIDDYPRYSPNQVVFDTITKEIK